MKGMLFTVICSLVLSVHLRAQTGEPHSPLLIERQGFYAGYLYTGMSGFPLSFEGDIFTGDIEKVLSSSPAHSFLAGLSIITPRKYFIGLEFEYARAVFSDINIRERTIHFYHGFLDVGYCFLSGPLVVPYLTVGGGGFHQKDHPGWMSLEGENEFFDENEYTFVWGIGIRFIPAPFLDIKAEIKFQYQTAQELDPVEDKPGWYYTEGNTKFTSIGKRVSVGAVFYFYTTK